MTSQGAERADPFSPPRVITDVNECYFYHRMDVPGHGLTSGEWDLRAGIDAYLGHYDFRGQRVLDVGAASGFLTFSMEKAGATVISYDLSEDDPWDIVPFGGTVPDTLDEPRRAHIRRLNNGYWFNHRAFNSRAKLAQGTAYNIPASIGMVDVTVFGSILLHLLDPFRALENGARLARKTVIVADVAPYGLFGRWLNQPAFRPDLNRKDEWDAWWRLPPRVIKRYLAVLGFPHARVNWHRQYFLGKTRWLYTVVATRDGA